MYCPHGRYTQAHLHRSPQSLDLEAHPPFPVPGRAHGQEVEGLDGS